MKYEYQKAILASHRLRDMRIYRAYTLGAYSYHEIGQKHGLSAARVGQIVNRIKRERKKGKKW